MYSDKAMDHFLNPRNPGVVAPGGPGDVGRGESENRDCGDTAVFTVRVVDGKVVEARFLSKGCAGAIAACSATTEWLVGRRVGEAEAVSMTHIAEALDGMPDSKEGCLEMATLAAVKAVRSTGR